MQRGEWKRGMWEGEEGLREGRWKDRGKGDEGDSEVHA